MIIEVKVLSPGESISQVTVANWLVGDGSFVTKYTIQINYYKKN